MDPLFRTSIGEYQSVLRESLTLFFLYYEALADLEDEMRRKKAGIASGDPLSE